MDKSGWLDRIRDATQSAGTYREEFESVIDTLAGIMERRDIAEAEFEDGGRQMIVEHTNKAGATNSEQNPLIRMINDCNRDALAYWRDLGLTPSGLKKINESAITVKDAESALTRALGALNGTGKETGT